MRICEPFDPELRKGLWLYHILEPELWSRVCARGRPWCKVCSPRGQYFGRQRPEKPAHHTWQSYACFLLDKPAAAGGGTLPDQNCGVPPLAPGDISQSDQKPPLPEVYGAFEASAGGMGADMNDVMDKSLQQLETSLSEMDEVARTLALNTIRQLH